MREVVEVDGARAGWTGDAIQRAVERCASAGGGMVRVRAGVYRLRSAVRLRSGVALVGEPGAVLLREPSIERPIADYLGYGLREFTVTDPSGLEPGMGVHLTDDGAGGFYDTVANIVRRDGNRFTLDRPLNHDYSPRARGRVATLFPVVEGVGIERARVERLVLDGNPDETRVLNGCRGGGLFLLGCRDVRVTGLEVRHFRGDGISFQQCCDVRVVGCDVHHCSGAGLHPGSGSVRYVFQGNRSHRNGGCGLFYCLRTTHSLCAGNRFEENGDAGISIGELDTDHRIAGNTVRGNGSGIHFRTPLAHGGDRVIVESNTIGPNGGPAEIVLTERLRDVCVRGNHFSGGERPALRVGPGCERIAFEANTVAGREQRAEDVAGDAAAIGGWRDIAVGPAALPLDGARHLGVAKLPRWEEAPAS